MVLAGDERGLGVSRQIIAAPRIVGTYSHPDAEADPDLLAMDPDLLAMDEERLLERRQHRARDRVRFHPRSDAVDAQAEGVSAYAGGGVRRRYRRLETMGDLHQHAITHPMAERMVDGAESI